MNVGFVTHSDVSAFGAVPAHPAHWSLVSLHSSVGCWLGTSVGEIVGVGVGASVGGCVDKSVGGCVGACVKGGGPGAGGSSLSLSHNLQAFLQVADMYAGFSTHWEEVASGFGPAHSLHSLLSSEHSSLGVTAWFAEGGGGDEGGGNGGRGG